MLEDLLVFFQETSETLTDLLLFLFNCFDIFLEFFSQLFETTGNFIGCGVGCVTSFFSVVYRIVSNCLQNFGEFFNLIGRSIILLVNLVPRTIYLIYAGSIKLFQCSKDTLLQMCFKLHQTVTTASPELLLGSVVGTLAMVVVTKYMIRTIREQHITWRSLLRAVLWLFCTIYIFIFSSIARWV